MINLNRCSLTMATMPAWFIFLALIAVVVASSKGVLSLEIGGFIGGIIFNGWMISACYLLHKKSDMPINIHPLIYVFLFIYLVSYHFIAKNEIYFFTLLCGFIIAFLIVFLSLLVSLIDKKDKSKTYKFLYSIMIFLGIIFYPFGIWFIQPAIIRSIR